MRMIWKFRLLIFVLATAVTLPAVDFGRVNTGNLAINGSFEGPPIDDGSSTATQVPGWEITSGAPVIQRGFNGISPYDGNQWLQLSSTSGNIYQYLPTTPGQQYQIRFAYASSSQSQSAISLVWGGNTISAYASTTTAFQAQSVTVTATSFTTRLQFARSGNPLLDGVSVIPLYGIMLPQFADGGPEGGRWDTRILIANPTDRDVRVETTVYGEDGVEFDPGLRFSRTMRAKETATFSSPATASSVRVGSVSVIADGEISLTSIFRFKATDKPDFEAAVPPRVPTYELIAPYDNTNGIVTGVAIANPRTERITLQFTFRDQNGSPLLTRDVSLVARGHLNLVLQTEFPAVLGTQGTMQIKGRTSDGKPSEFVAIGLRFNPSGPFVTLPY